MLEGSIVLWGGEHDGEILSARAYMEFPTRISTLRSYAWASLLDNVSDVSIEPLVITYCRTGWLDRAGNMIYRMERE